MWIYNLGLVLYVWAIALASPWHRKAKLWIDGRKGLFRRMKESIDLGSHYLDTCRLPGRIRTGPSPDRKNPQGTSRIQNPAHVFLLRATKSAKLRSADYIFYLPIDTPRKARRFLDIAHPEIAIFVKYEFWINLLTELRRRSIRSYIVSAIFRRNSIFFRPYGGYWRMALEVSTRSSFRTTIPKITGRTGFDNVVVAGDTRFDRLPKLRLRRKNRPHRTVQRRHPSVDRRLDLGTGRRPSDPPDKR